MRTLSMLVLAAACLHAQPFRVDSANVIVDVTVVDKKGKPVTGLPADAFRLFENGLQQKMVAFEGPGGGVVMQRRGNNRYFSLVVDQANTTAAGRKALVKAASD